jgi:hypothetical protein
MSTLQLAPRNINNQRLPGDGPKMIRVPMNFTGTPALNWDLSTLTQRGFISQIQTAYIDNGNSPSPLTINFGSPVAQSITVPAYTQGYYPVLAPDNILTAQSLGAVPVYINLLNVPVPPSHWSVQNTSANSYDGGGNLKTVDQNIAAAMTPGGTSYLETDTGPFLGVSTSAVMLAATTTSARVALASPTAPALQVTNESASFAWIVFGTSSVVAAFPTNATPVDGLMIAPNSIATIGIPPGMSYVAGILRSGTGNITFVAGMGK